MFRFWYRFVPENRSIKGFTKGCAEAAAKMKNVTLVSYENLLEKITE